MKILLGFIILILFASCSDGYQQVIIENDIFSRVYEVNSKQGSIKVSADISDHDLNTVASAWFEFVINNQLVSSNDPVWQYQGLNSAKIENGGEQYEILFTGVAKPVNGLQVKILQQIFPGTTWIREKLILSSKEAEFQLNKLDQQLHFIFPQYTLPVDAQPVNATEIRIASWELKPTSFEAPSTGKPTGNHMYYPNILTSPMQTGDQKRVKGPINIIETEQLSWITLYEHASQDDLSGMIQKDKIASDGRLVDAMQGTKGVFDFTVNDEDFTFLGINQEINRRSVTVGVEIVRGGYLEGEVIDPQHPYETVWSASAFYQKEDLEKGKELIRDYLFNWICDQPASRKPEFYYNTWGMQRADPSKPLRGILTYDRIKEEIERAAKLGVDIFVLDDGWEQTQGVWQPHSDRLPEGLAPIKAELDKHGITMGAWLSPMGIDSTTNRYKSHPEWIIKDSEGNPIEAQWGHPAFDFVSGFYDLLIEDCKKLVDDGVRFFKWDAINTFYSSLPNLEHGSDQYSEEELRARYEYLLPIYVVKAMEELTEYEPELIIEVDLTEARRVMTGLAPLSEGKLFWMNNGASWYNDYTTFRTKSMRTIPNEFAGIIPLELFTYANYPQNIEGKWEYNVNTSLISGHGFWGDLSLMNNQEMNQVGKRVAKSKLILPYITDVNTEVIGEVGDSPEIYTQVNPEQAAGQVIAFSDDTLTVRHEVELEPDQLLAVLNHTYHIEGKNLILDFHFGSPESTLEAFIIPQSESSKGISFIASTGILDQVKVEQESLVFTVETPGLHKIKWPKNLQLPSENENLQTARSDGYNIIEIKTEKPAQTVRLKINEIN